MENTHAGDVLQQPRKLTSMLNVLTILTFIGCGFAYVSGIYNLLYGKNPQQDLEELDRQREKLGDNPLVNNIVDSGVEFAQKSWEHRYELLICTFVFTTFCLVGALMMRRMKRTGFYIYLVGEIAPIVVTGLLIGFSLVGDITAVLSAVVALVFIILYATQLKYMR
jgi:hypothetical protein